VTGRFSLDLMRTQ